jgi:hypothetical protein
MDRKRSKKDSGYAMLLEILIASAIALVFLGGALVSAQRIIVGTNQNAAWEVLRAINKSEGFYFRVYHDGYVLPGVLANSSITGLPGTVAPQNCNTPGLLGADYASEITQPVFQGYSFAFLLGPTVTQSGTGCTNPGAQSYQLFATPVNRGNQTGMYLFTDQTGVIRCSLTGPANASSPILTW